MISSMILTSKHTGVKIEGPASGPGVTLDRANTSFNVIELQNADNVTFDRLTIRGGYNGISASTSSDSDNVSIINSSFVGNSNSGIYLDTSNDSARFLGNAFDSTGTNYSLVSYGNDAVISTNRFTGGFYDSGTVRGPRSVVSNNTFSYVRNGIGISNFSSAASDRIVVRDNNYFEVRETAISTGGNVLVTGNTIKRAGTGISGSGEYLNNVVSDGITGIYGSGIVVDNRIYNSSSIGLILGGSPVNSGNRLYNNNVGIRLDFGSAGAVTNNIVYNSSDTGIQIYGGGYYGGTPTISGNTIIQSVGNGVYVFDSRSQNVLVKNNIIQASGGYAIKVEPDSSRGFQSDYNVINITGTGKIGRWENTDFNDPADWFYEVGLDQHSQFADPQFVNLAGPDGVLGFQDSIGTGLTASYYGTQNFTNLVLTQLVNGIGYAGTNGSPAPGVPADNYSIRWEGYIYISAPGTYRFYEQADDGMRLFLGDVGSPLSSTATIDQWDYSNFSQFTGSKTFATSGWVPIRIDHRETTGSSGLSFSWSGPSFSQQGVATRYLSPTLVSVPTDYGADDNFAVSVTSPAIDAGNPTDPFYLEPGSNGGRVNVGAYSNTALAEQSSPQSIQVLTPNGLEKYEQGQTVKIDFRTSNLLSIEPIVFINGGTNQVDRWLPGSQFLQSGGTATYTNGAVDRSGVVNPPPAEVYNSQLYGSETLGDHLVVRIPVGTSDAHQVRLHFSDPFYGTAGNRKFDIAVNGVTKRTNYEIGVAAGGNNKAVVEEYSNITAVDGAITIDLTNRQGGFPRGPMISAIEVLRVNPQGTPNPRVDLDVSNDNGLTWSPIATNVAIDRTGTGTYNWTIPSGAPESASYKIRARAMGSDGEQSDVSDRVFGVANSGNSYFVSPDGDNKNPGKAVDRPMKSLSGLIGAYDLDSGDVVNLKEGAYRLYRNTSITSEDSGVTLRGSTTNPSVISRGNTNVNQYVFSVLNANGVTIDQLRLTGAEIGIIAPDGSNSDNLSITNSQIYGNSYAGVYVGTTNDNWTVTGSKLYGKPAGSTSDDQQYGMYWNGGSVGHLIQGNEIYDHATTGLHQPMPGTIVSQNDIHGNRGGIGVDYFLPAGSTPAVIRDNKIRDNFEYGLYADSRSGVPILVTNNEVYGHNGDNDIGMYLYRGTVGTNNTVYGNFKGIVSFSDNSAQKTTVTDNRLYNNRFAAITADGYSQIIGNYIYSNSIGVQVLTSFVGNVNSNLVYANTNRGS